MSRPKRIKIKNPHAVALGSRGGKSNFEKHGREFFKEISAKGKETLRKKKLEKQTESKVVLEDTTGELFTLD